MRLSYPHTTPQNGCVERIIHAMNDVMRSLMFQASIPAAYWAEALYTVTYLLNLHPTKTLTFLPLLTSPCLASILTSLIFVSSDANVILTFLSPHLTN
jgi:hypothetical protein